MYLSSQVGQYYKCVASTNADLQFSEFKEMTDHISKKDGGRFMRAWITAQNKQSEFFGDVQQSILKNDFLHPAHKEQYRKRMTEYLLGWRNKWNWANPSQVNFFCHDLFFFQFHETNKFFQLSFGHGEKTTFTNTCIHKLPLILPEWASHSTGYIII